MINWYLVNDISWIFIVYVCVCVCVCVCVLSEIIVLVIVKGAKILCTITWNSGHGASEWAIVM